MPKPTRPKHRQGLAELSVHDRLLEAAKELFASDGYENASTASIARRAGSSESQLIKHFGSKEGLLEATFEDWWGSLEQDLRHVLGDVSSPLDKFMALGGVFISALGRDSRLKSLMLLQGRRIRKRGRDIVLTAGFRQFVQALDDVLREMQAAGQLRPDVHLEAARSVLMGALEGLLRDQLLAEIIDYPARYTKKQLLSTYTLVLGAFLQPEAMLALRRSEGEALFTPRAARG